MTLTNPLSPDLATIHERFSLKGRLADSTVIITGAGGFLGFYLVHYLVDYADALGLRGVVAIDPGAGAPGHWLHAKAATHPLLTVISSSVTDVDVSTFVAASDPLHVIHAASIASPTFYRRFPKETIDANIWGLRHMLDGCLGLNLRGFLFFSSSEIYGDPTPDAIPTDEEYRGNVSCTGPRACYDESKRFGETIAWIYAQQNGMPITVVRPFNNYGPGMSIADKRLPADLCARVLAGDDIELFSSGAPTRTFCYVADAVAGYLQALAYGQYDYFNIGNDQPELSVDEFAGAFQRIAAELIGYEGRIVRLTSDDPEYLTHNPQRRCPDLTKARTLLGYAPTVGVEEGIARYLSHASLTLQGVLR